MKYKFEIQELIEVIVNDAPSVEEARNEVVRRVQNGEMRFGSACYISDGEEKDD